MANYIITRNAHLVGSCIYFIDKWGNPYLDIQLFDCDFDFYEISGKILNLFTDGGTISISIFINFDNIRLKKFNLTNPLFYL